MSPVNSFFGIPTAKIAAAKLERLIGRDVQFLPEDVRKFAIRIARRVEPFEAYSGVINWECHRDVVDLFSLLMGNGAFGEELVADVARLARRMHEALIRRLTKFTQGGMSERAFDSYCAHFGNAFEQQIMIPILADGRRLAWLCLSEGLVRFRAFAIQMSVEAVGIDSIMRGLQLPAELASKQAASNDRDMYEASWWQMVDWLDNEPDPNEIMSQEQFVEAVGVLSETEFADFGEPIQVPLPRVFGSLAQATCSMTILPGLVFTGLIDFVLYWPPGNSLNWTLSRMGGHFMSRTSLLLPFDAPFKHYDKLRAYEYLCRASVAAVLEAMHIGALREDVYVGGDDFMARLELSRLSRLIASLPDIPESRAAELEVMETRPVPIARVAPTADASLVFDTTGSMGTRRHPKRPKPAYQPKGLSWRKIMNGLHGYGVEIDITTTHPKLNYMGRPAGFLNRHSNEDEVFNCLVLERTLAALGIDPDAFYRSL